MTRTLILGDSNPNYMYIGTTDLTEDEFLTKFRTNMPIKLTGARIFQHQIMTVMTPDGPNTMASTKVYPFPLTNSGADVHIIASTLIDVDSSPEIQMNIKQLVNSCLDLEQRLRAQQSGLVMADKLPKI